MKNGVERQLEDLMIDPNNIKRMISWTQNTESTWLDNIFADELIKSRRKDYVLSNVLKLEKLSQKEAKICLQLYGNYAIDDIHNFYQIGKVQSKCYRITQDSRNK